MIRTCISQIVFLLLFALAPGLSAEEGGWYHRDGTPAPNTDAMKSRNGFGGWLVVTPAVE